MPHREQRKAPGDFESVSLTPGGIFIRVRHDTLRAAKARLLGVPRHTAKAIFDHTPKPEPKLGGPSGAPPQPKPVAEASE